MDMPTVTLLVSLAALVISLLALAIAVRTSRYRDDATGRTLPGGAVLNPGVSPTPPPASHRPHATTTVSNSTFEVPSEVMELVRRGEKIQAIKVLRDAHPTLGLAEAKRAVDGLSQL